MSLFLCVFPLRIVKALLMRGQQVPGAAPGINSFNVLFLLCVVAWSWSSQSCEEGSRACLQQRIGFMAHGGQEHVLRTYLRFSPHVL